MADQSVIGLTTVKINGTYRVDVKNARWSIRRAGQEYVTAGGVRISKGAQIPTGTFDEVIPRAGQFDWRGQSSFSIEILDQETRSVTIFAAEGCEWQGLDGSTDLGQASTGRTIAWHGTGVVAG
jgi:hypothetical protein